MIRSKVCDGGCEECLPQVNSCLFLTAHPWVWLATRESTVNKIVCKLNRLNLVFERWWHSFLSWPAAGIGISFQNLRLHCSRFISRCLTKTCVLLWPKASFPVSLVLIWQTSRRISGLSLITPSSLFATGKLPLAVPLGTWMFSPMCRSRQHTQTLPGEIRPDSRDKSVTPAAKVSLEWCWYAHFSWICRAMWVTAVKPQLILGHGFGDEGSTSGKTGDTEWISYKDTQGAAWRVWLLFRSWSPCFISQTWKKGKKQ